MNMQETPVMTLRPSKLLALDKWITAIALSCIWAILAVQLTALAEMRASMLAVVMTKMVTTGAVFVPCIFPLVWAGWKTIQLRCIVYQISSQRIIRRTGVFGRTYDEIELVRVRDFEVVEPFYLRMMGLGHLRVYSAENNTPVIVIRGQEHILQLRDQLRQLVLSRQQTLGYREVGVGGGI